MLVSILRRAPMRIWTDEIERPRRGARPSPGLLAFSLLLALFAGCATVPRGPSDDIARIQLRPAPKVRPSALRSDPALVAAFFSAYGIPLADDQVREIIPDSAPQGRLDRNAVRRIAKNHNRLLRVVKADERFLGNQIGRNLPLLVLLPSGNRYCPAAAPLIPMAWDKKNKTIDLLGGDGAIHSVSEASFFERREPLRHAALCLVKAGGLRGPEPGREQTLLLADFWFDQSFYRRTEVVFTAIQEDFRSDIADVDELLRSGNALIRKGRYKEAIPVFQAALALDPENPKILNNLAYTMLHGGGELMTALRHANKALRLDPDNPLVLETLGTLNLRVGDSLAAAKYLERAWARGLRRSPEVQIAIMDQLIRAWLAADRQDLAWQVAEHRHRAYPDYRIPRDILLNFPALSRAVQTSFNTL